MIRSLPDCEQFFPPSLSLLNLSKNKLSKIKKRSFNNTSNLDILYLNDNSIRYIENDTFESCRVLVDLNLAHNPFTSLGDVLSNFHNLLTLVLKGVPLTNMKTSWFKDLKSLLSIEFTSFDMCRYTPNVVVCLPHTDGISSITNLLNNGLLGICIWVVALVTCVGNVLVMICRIAFREEKNVHSLFIKNLAAADFMLGIYLLVIACHDVMYRDMYNAYAVTWMEGWTCQVAGFMGLMALEVSVFILTCMSLECCLTVSLPLKPRLLTVSRATVVLMLMWVAGGVIAGIPIVFSAYFGPFYGGNGVCLPLHIHDPFTNGWQYSTFIFIFVNILGMLVIILCYLVILLSFRKTRSMVEKADGLGGGRGRRDGEKHLARRMNRMDKRMFMIVITNVLCWIPIIVIKLLALNSIMIPDIFYAWLAIFVVPINSALNPIIYSITTVNFRQKFVKRYNVDKLSGNVRGIMSVLEGRLRRSSKSSRSSHKRSSDTAASLLALPDIMLFHKYRTVSSNKDISLDESASIEKSAHIGKLVSFYKSASLDKLSSFDKSAEKNGKGSKRHNRADHVSDDFPMKKITFIVEDETTTGVNENEMNKGSEKIVSVAE